MLPGNLLGDFPASRLHPPTCSLCRRECLYEKEEQVRGAGDGKVQHWVAPRVKLAPDLAGECP